MLNRLLQGIVDVAHRNRLTDYLALSKDVVERGYHVAPSGELQLPPGPYKRQRTLKSVLAERLQQGLPVDEAALRKAAGWSCNDT